MEFKIDGKLLGGNAPVYLMAEVGTTANGDLATAKKLIDAVKEAGFDAIKFQNISPKDYMSDRAVTYKYMTADGPREKNMFEMLEPLVFSKQAWGEIMSYAKSKSITCFATVNWLGGVDMMEEFGAPAYKIASWDLNYPDLQRKIFATGKPAFVDLGPVGILEVIRIRELAHSLKNKNIVFLYDFHTPHLAEMHMRAIPYLEKTLGEFVGFSSPGKDWELDVMSLGLGARVLEKRVTLNDKDAGHHHFVAVTAEEARTWVKKIRDMETALGQSALIASEHDLHDAQKYFRGITALRSIKKGEVFSAENLGAKRPWKGIDPARLDVVWGAKAAADIGMDTQIGWNLVDNSKN